MSAQSKYRTPKDKYEQDLCRRSIAGEPLSEQDKVYLDEYMDDSKTKAKEPKKGPKPWVDSVQAGAKKAGSDGKIALMARELGINATSLRSFAVKGSIRNEDLYWIDLWLIENGYKEVTVSLPNTMKSVPKRHKSDTLFEQFARIYMRDKELAMVEKSVEETRRFRKTQNGGSKDE